MYVYYVQLTIRIGNGNIATLTVKFGGIYPPSPWLTPTLSAQRPGIIASAHEEHALTDHTDSTTSGILANSSFRTVTV